IMRLIVELDSQPPQVVIQCLIAEVDLNATEEFGVELGLQSPLMFARSVVNPQGGSTVTFTNASTTTSGFSVGSSTSQGTAVSAIGFNFNQTGPLGQNVAQGPGTVAFQGLGNLGVGRSDPNLGFGGFVFSAASDTFSLLIRALKVQNRI